jgi:hypothetical protein
MNSSTELSDSRAAEHLRLLSIFHYILAGLYFLGGFLPIAHLVIGYLMAFKPEALGEGGQNRPPVLVGVLFMAVATALIFLAWGLAALTALSGWCIRHRRNRMLSLVVGGLNCIVVPFGTVLGVFTIIALERAEVREVYSSKEKPRV